MQYIHGIPPEQIQRYIQTIVSAEREDIKNATESYLDGTMVLREYAVSESSSEGMEEVPEFRKGVPQAQSKDPIPGYLRSIAVVGDAGRIPMDIQNSKYWRKIK